MYIILLVRSSQRGEAADAEIRQQAWEMEMLSYPSV
jgi:hypothetical protein